MKIIYNKYDVYHTKFQRINAIWRCYISYMPLARSLLFFTPAILGGEI